MGNRPREREASDAFPDDPNEQSDRDLDGVGDAGDPLPDDPTQPRRARPAPGSIVVPAGASGLFQVDPESGALSWLAFAPGFSPDQVAVAPSGSIYTHDRESATLHRVFSSTGEIRVVATGVGGALGLDAYERPVLGGQSGVVRVDPAAG